MRIALAQMQSTDDKQINLAQVHKFTADAAAQGADLVVLPEFAMFELAQLSEAFVDAAEPLDGPFATAVRDLASQHRITIVLGMIETSDVTGKAYNTLLAVGPDGQTIGAYRKQHLYDAFGFQESEHICPGPTGDPVVIAVGNTRIGLLTCYDLRFPEAARVLVDEGADVLLYPASWVPGPRKEDHWTTLAKARAIENTVFVAAVDQAPPLGVGCTVLVDPMGLVVGQLGEATGLLIRDIDTQRIGAVRRFNPSLANRRYSVTVSA